MDKKIHQIQKTTNKLAKEEVQLLKMDKKQDKKLERCQEDRKRTMKPAKKGKK